MSHSLFGGNVGKFSMVEISGMINSLLTSALMHKDRSINFKLNITFFPQHWQVKAENELLWCSLGLQKNPCTLLREGAKRQMLLNE